MTSIRAYRADLPLWSTKACLALLDGAEKQRAARTFNDRARHEFVAARALLRLLLSRRTGQPTDALKIATGDCGKPILLGHQDVHFNVSHSDSVALVAIAPSEVGIDIERIDDGIDYWVVAASVFSSAEVDMLRNAPLAQQREVFFSLWTRKEAYLKATGRGFSSELPGISTASPKGIVDERGVGHGQRWFASNVPVPAGFKAALVTTSPECKIEVVDATKLAHSLPAGPQAQAA